MGRHRRTGAGDGASMPLENSNGSPEVVRVGLLNEEALTLARKTGDPIATIFGLGLGALAAVGRGEHRRAGSLCAEGFALALEFGHERPVIHYLHICAVMAGAEGYPIRAARLWGATEALQENIGAALSPVETRYFEPYIRAVREALDELMRESAWDRGRAMTRKEATDYALSEEARPAEEVGGHASVPLSPREREVAGLISGGFTNRKIAEALDITARTADTHVAAILRKLGLSSRQQVGAWAKENLPE